MSIARFRSGGKPYVSYDTMIAISDLSSSTIAKLSTVNLQELPVPSSRRTLYPSRQVQLARRFSQQAMFDSQYSPPLSTPPSSSESR